VTGAKGQLGGELCRLLGGRAAVLDIDTLDLTDRQAVLDTFLAVRPAVIINCAAFAQVDKAETEPELARAVNVGAVENLVEVCRRLDCRLVQISTDYVFGEGGRPKTEGGDPRPWKEDDEPSPQGVYARSKLEGERAAAKLEKHIIVRTCGLYARRSAGNARNFVKTILHYADTRPELRVVNDQHCTPSYVPHVAAAVLFLAGAAPETASVHGDLQQGSGHPPSAARGIAANAKYATNGTRSVPAAMPAVGNYSGVYHVTNRGATTWHEFAAEILRLAGKSTPVVPITTAEFAAAAPRPSYSVLDTTKYRSLGGPEMPEWKIGLQDYFEERS